ncbi:MAG: hypothetical protein ACKOYN_02610 [Planctomycetota bacterium]
MIPSALPATSAALLGQSDPSGGTLESFAREVQQLPVASLAPALVLFLAGALLLVAGRALLKPVLVVTIVLASALLAAPLLGPSMPGLNGFVLTVLGTAIGVLLAAIAWRVVLGAATGTVTAFLCALVAAIGVEAGLIDARLPTDAPPAEVSLAEIADREAMIEKSPAIVRPLVSWAESRWSAETDQVRTLFRAAAAGGGFIGFVLGVWLPKSASAFLTSLVGAMFAMVGAMPFLARHFDRLAEPVSPVGWLFVWLSLALAGWLFQSWRGEDADENHGRSAKRDRGDGAESTASSDRSEA